MKLLLDECVPFRVRPLLVGHDVYTVAFMGWKGFKNGRLLALAASRRRRHTGDETAAMSIALGWEEPLPRVL